MTREFLICGAAILALSACSKKAGDTATTATATSASAGASTGTSTTVTTTASGSSAFMTMPSRKPGLWEQTMNSDRVHQSVSLCLDAALDQKMKVWGADIGKSKCSEERVTQHLGGGLDFHSVCAMGESGTITSDGQVTGDLGSHYTVNVTSSTVGSSMPQANAVRKIAIEATWKGPCPPDMKAGDMRLPGGMTLNMAGGTPTVEGGPSRADIAKLRAQAEAMKKMQTPGQ